mgnify:CR=1 FL=1
MRLRHECGLKHRHGEAEVLGQHSEERRNEQGELRGAMSSNSHLEPSGARGVTARVQGVSPGQLWLATAS